MKHEKEWYTCDRCGKEIIQYGKKRVHIKTQEIEPLNEDEIYTAKDLAQQTLPMLVWEEECKYDLCPKCRKDFERFMENGKSKIEN